MSKHNVLSVQSNQKIRSPQNQNLWGLWIWAYAALQHRAGQQVDVVWIERGKPSTRQMRWGWRTKRWGTINTVEAHHAYHQIYAEAWKTGRCLIPADGYYEWKNGCPYRVVMTTRKPFWFAGLFHEGEVLILTAPAVGWLRDAFGETHPVALAEREIDWWLKESKEYREHEGWGVINRGICPSVFEAYAVFSQVADVNFESPECVEERLSPDESFSRLTMKNREHWNEVTESPIPGHTVDVLLADDITTYAEWTGQQWRGVRFADSCPVLWKRQSGYRPRA